MRTQFVIPVLVSILILGILGSFTSQMAYAAPGDFISSFDGTAGSGTEFSFTHAVAVDSNDRIIVADFSLDIVQIFNSTGSFLDSFDGTTTDATQFLTAGFITVDSTDRIIVVDAVSGIVQIFDSTGSFVSSFDGTAGGGTQFLSPRGVTTDSNDRIIVVDSLWDIVQIFDSTGSFLSSFDGTAGGGTKFSSARGITVDSNDRIIVSDDGIDIVQIFNSTGSFLSSFDGSDSDTTRFLGIDDITVDSTDRIIVVENFFQIVQIFNSTGSFLSSFDGSAGGGTQFINPRAVAVDSNDRIIVADSSLNTVQIFEGFSHETFTTVSDGVWDSADTWEDSEGNPGVPGEADDKVIAHIVTMSSPVINSGLISNNGILIAEATLTNSGSAVFDNLLGAEIRLDNVGFLVNDFGATINNQGTINILHLSGLSNIDGVIINKETGSINLNETSSMFTNFATVDNEGDINNIMGEFINLKILNNKSTGIINNTKTLKNDSVFSILNNEGTLENHDIMDNDGIINNKPAGIINNTKTLNNKVGSTLGNEGILENHFILENDGTINNNSTGTINNIDFLGNFFGSTLNNEGILNNYHEFENDGTLNNKENATITNFDMGIIDNSGDITNNGTIINMGTLTNTGTLNNDNYIENKKQIDNTSGTINNTCLINNSGSVPNMGGDLNNQNIINNTGMLAVQPGGTFSNTGTLIGNMEVNILEDEIIPEDDKIKGRIVVVTPDRLAKNTDKVGQLPLKGAKMTFSHSGSPIMQDSDRTDGNFFFDVPTKKDTVSLETILKDGASMGFPDGLFEVHHAVKGTPVKFKTENFNSCIRIAFLELSFDSPEFKLSGKDSTPTLTGLAISDVDRLADLAAIYYYTFIGFDFLSTHVPEVTVDKIPLLVIGYSTESKTNNSNFFTNTTPPTIDIGTDDGTLVLGAFSRGKHTETQFDVLYHEFGHYITYESKISGENSNVNKVANVHPLLAGVPDFGGCHVGYANQESSCAFDEGFASFVGAVIQEKMLTDTKHKPKFDADVFKSRAGDSFLNNDLYDVFGERVGGVKIFRPLYEEFAVSSLLWALYSPNWINTVSNDFNALMGVFGIPSLNDISDLYATMKNSGLVSNADLDMIFGLYKICIDANNNFNCDVSEVHGETAWKNVKRSAILFSYPIPGSMINRTDLPPYLPSLVSFDVEDLTGNTIMDGTEVIIETISAGGEIFSYTSIVYDGKLTTNFLMAEGSHTNLIFSNDDYFSESITITQEQYFNGFVDEDVLNSLGFTVKMNQRDSCIPPMSGDWTISASCELIENTIAPGNVTITNTSVMEILSGKTLTITSGNNITIEKDSGLSIIANGTLQINS